MAEECRRPISKNRRTAMIDETPRSIADLAVRGPVRRESATRAPLNCGPERDIPVSRPATRDQAIFVEYLVQKLVHLNSVMSEFAGCVSQSAVEIVAVHLDYCASRMRKGQSAFRRVWCAGDHGVYTDVNECLFQELIEIKNVVLQRRYSHPVDKSTGVRSDQTVVLTTSESARAYPDALRRISYVDATTNNHLVFLTNNFVLPALTIARIYQCRWQVELFFKWIKQHLRIKASFGTSENAVKIQIWIALSIYVLVAIVLKRLGLEASLYQILQVLSITLFEKTPILRALQASDSGNDLLDPSNQLNLWDF